MRDRGYLCDVTEHWQSFARKRKDLYGIIDVLALKPGEIVGVQTTSRGNISARIAKIAEHPHIDIIRKSGLRLLVHGWDKPKHRWRLKEVDVS